MGKLAFNWHRPEKQTERLQFGPGHVATVLPVEVECEDEFVAKPSLSARAWHGQQPYFVDDPLNVLGCPKPGAQQTALCG